MKSFTKYLCLCLAFLLPFAAHAKFTGEVIFIYPDPGNDYNELWITHIENAKNPRLLYKHNETEFSTLLPYRKMVLSSPFLQELLTLTFSL